MIGFIIIGKNEGTKLVRCITSIIRTIDEDNIGEYEIIYVDSNSSDSSIELVKEIEGNIKIYELTGKANPAIGRNVGAAESKADHYCFMDGDMELVNDFLPNVIDESGDLKYPFVSGQFENVYYDLNDQRIGSELYMKNVLTGDRYQSTTGGLFIIEKGLWEKVGGMDTRFITGEDLDLGLRLARKGHLLLRKKELFAIHHTRHYKSKTRMWKDLFAGKTLYARGVLYRKHILLLNPHIFKRILKSDPTCLLLILSSLLTLITKEYYMLLIYLLGIIIGNLFYRKNGSLSETLSGILYQFVRDVLTIFSFLFFYPRKADLQYDKVK
jgi:glycosyltransferase involved in cell wall biosynthesis